ncbi:unnamed protein product [Thlaspi arvense]|uniref:Uncharacterized protein n=1 Tax=Thlaspi arvense TaxID=13288 RepID=A0AAU9T2K1_THLAR|nr:unnamed protein product [Thlaspi arvense]
MGEVKKEPVSSRIVYGQTPNEWTKKERVELINLVEFFMAWTKTTYRSMCSSCNRQPSMDIYS